MGSNKTKKFKDGYYFRVAYPWDRIEKNYLDSMVIVKDGKIDSFYYCTNGSWVDSASTSFCIGLPAHNYEKVTMFKLEFMGDL